MKRINPKEMYLSTLYIVPTPIGNFDDITYRALKVLAEADLIAAEDTRTIGLLLKQYSIDTKLFSFHQHNEKQKVNFLLLQMQQGLNVALVSDAGTPLISDPGYHLVRCCYEHGIRVVPLPGACAAITGLIGSGLPTDRFCYEGFLPSKKYLRCSILRTLLHEERTMIFYESTHRLIASLQDMITEWGDKRYIVLARELTKTWESIYGAPVGELLNWIKSDEYRCKGEIVIIVRGYEDNKDTISIRVLRTLSLLQKEVSFKIAVRLTANIHRVSKNKLYQYAVHK